jgi:hypothetical protein
MGGDWYELELSLADVFFLGAQPEPLMGSTDVPIRLKEVAEARGLEAIRWGYADHGMIWVQGKRIYL